MEICVSSYCFHNAFENKRLDALSFPSFCGAEYGVRKIEFYDPDFFRGPAEVPSIMDMPPDHPHVTQAQPLGHVLLVYQRLGEQELCIDQDDGCLWPRDGQHVQQNDRLGAKTRYQRVFTQLGHRVAQDVRC